MSETVHYRGTLTVVERLESETLEEQCKRILEGKELESYHDSHEDMLRDIGYKQYLIRDDIIYDVKKKEIGEDDMFIITEGKDGTLNFEVSYYNGGCSFDEAMEYAFNNKE